ncbi:MAG: hypothetical protein JO045_08335 [Mycobacterium sp.]|nr:hypothetical protein [Mycobacterium sp.]
MGDKNEEGRPDCNGTASVSNPNATSIADATDGFDFREWVETGRNAAQQRADRDIVAQFDRWFNGKPNSAERPHSLVQRLTDRGHGKLLRRPANSADRPAIAAAPIDTTDRNRAYAAATLAEVAREVAGTPEGARNHTLNANALRAYRVADAAGIDRQIVTDTMADAGRACGLDDREIDGTLRSAAAGADQHGAAGIPDGDTNGHGNTDFGPDPDAAGSGNGGRRPPRYTDFAALLAGGLPDPPAPTILRRADGRAIIYPGKRNEFYGDPEDGKTMVALAAAAEHLAAGGAVLFLDLDNNGAIETAQRLLMLGAPRDTITNPDKFRHIEPDDAAEVCNIVADCAGWATLVLIDCVGELLPLFSGSSDSADDYTAIMQRTAAPLERGGAAVLLIDHQAKGRESRSYGAGGTMAKRRAISGVSINVMRRQTFAPGQGGAAELWINKDRPGGLRQHCPRADGRRQFAGTFTLDPPDTDTGTAAWRVTADRTEPAAAIDPVVERHYTAAAKLAAGTVTGATVAAVSAAANGLPAGTPPTRPQKETARRSLQSLARVGRLVLVADSQPQRWEVSDDGDC